MKMFFFIISMKGGGAERVVSTLSTYFSREEHVDVTIVTMGKSECAYELPEEVSLQYLRTGILCKGVGKILFMPLVALELARLLKRNKPDATVSLLIRTNLIHVMTKWFGNQSKIFLSERANSVFHYSGNGLPNRMMKSMIRWLYSKADKVISISGGVQEGLVNIGVRNKGLVTIHNPQNISKIKAQSLEPCSLQVPEGVHILVTIGRLDYQKDYPTLLNSMKKIKEKRDVHLVIIGEGPLEDELKSYAKKLGVSNAVTWAGWQSNPFAIMAKSDLFVLTSTYEGFGNVLVEAMACGLPVVTTDCPSGPGEILDDGKYGELVPVGDSGAIARAVIELLGDKARYDEMCRLSDERSMDFDVKVVAYKYLRTLGF